MTKEVRSTIYLLITAIIWGFAFVAQRVGTEYVGCFTYNGVRYVLGTISLLPVIILFEREKLTYISLKKTTVASIITGTILFLASSLQQLGIEIGQSAGKAGFITSLYIVLVPVFRMFFGKKASFATWIGVTLSVVGLYFLSISDTESVNLGDFIVFIGSFFWAAHILVIDKFVEDISPLKYSMGQFLVCAILSLACAFVFENPKVNEIADAAVPILYGGVMSVGIAYTFQVLGQRGVSPEFASIICSTEAVFSAIGGAMILGETMTIRGYAGCVLIFAGILLAQVNKKKI
ncbi:MAG: DMT family transporter [Clostridia bacterium]|nr:DMT family transporter [Clostridia bacterium]